MVIENQERRYTAYRVYMNHAVLMGRVQYVSLERLIFIAIFAIR